MSYERQGSVDIYRLAGPLTEQHVERVRTEMVKTLDEGRIRIILDCGRMPLCDSEGLELLLMLNDRCRSKGGRLTLIHLGGLAQEIFRVTGLESQLQRYGNETEALRSFAV